MSEPERGKHAVLAGDVIIAGGYEFYVEELHFSEWRDPAKKQYGARLGLRLAEVVVDEPEAGVLQIEQEGVD
jgi:hypothetical protein